MRARLQRFVPAPHNAIQAAGSVAVVTGALVLFGVGVALIVAGVLIFALGVLMERG